MIKFSFRDLLTLLTLGALFHGVLELKKYLEVNFVDNETLVKRKLNHALNNGFEPPKKPRPRKSQTPD